MAVKVYKPTTPGRRKSSVLDFSELTNKRPEKSLVEPVKKHSGRNNSGHITVRHRGGGVKRLYRIIDNRRQDYDIVGTVEAIEYDPNRGAHIALIAYPQEKKYILAGKDMKAGDTVLSSEQQIEAVPGNRMPLKHIPIGMFIYDLEMNPGKGGQIVKGAGATAQLQVIEGQYAQIKLPSGEMRLFSKECMATIGQVSNTDYKLVRLGKAGRKRKLGWKPTVKGKNMNPVDHPHGGGEGHSPIGLKGGPKTPWGKKALGVKTRKRGKWSDKFIVKSRKK